MEKTSVGGSGHARRHRLTATEKEKLASFLGNYGYNVSVERYTENYCMLRVGPDLYRFEYGTEKLLFTR